MKKRLSFLKPSPAKIFLFIVFSFCALLSANMDVAPLQKEKPFLYYVWYYAGRYIPLPLERVLEVIGLALSFPAIVLILAPIRIGSYYLHISNQSGYIVDVIVILIFQYIMAAFIVDKIEKNL